MTPDQLKAAAEKYAREVYSDRAKGKSIAHFSVTNTDAYDSYLAGAELMRAEISKRDAVIKVMKDEFERLGGLMPINTACECGRFVSVNYTKHKDVLATVKRMEGE